VRARVYGLLKVPQNAFVVVVLSMVKEGARYKDGVFVGCSEALVVTSGVLGWVVDEQITSP